jgi:hypothetical protein
MRLLVALLLSALAHAAALGGFAASAPAGRPALVPIDVAEAPPVPPPPEPPPPEPTPPPPKPAKPKVKRVRAAAAAEGLPVALADAGVVAQSGESDAPDAGTVAELSDAGTGAPAKVDPAVVDLRPFLPPGERVMLALRADRLRATPWAAAVEAVLAPMPDYRAVIAGTGVGIADTFDTVVIASPAPRDVAQTFLAGRTDRGDAALRRQLARGSRVTWSPVAGGSLGRRATALAGDPRVLLVPAPGWFLLVRPEHVGDLLAPTPAQATPPPWLALLERIDEQTGDGTTLAVVVASDFGAPTIRFGGHDLPAPDRLTTALSFDQNGLVLTGAAVFADEAGARAFADALADAQKDLLGSVARRLLLRSFRLDGALARLQLAQHGGAVTFSTSITNAEATVLFDEAAAMSRRAFTP